jgi:hypothetical protein
MGAVRAALVLYGFGDLNVETTGNKRVDPAIFRSKRDMAVRLKSRVGNRVRSQGHAQDFVELEG